MSGGTFEYNEWHIGEIAETIRQLILQHRDANWVNRQKDGWASFTPYPKKVLKKFEEAYKCLYQASIYAKRVDYLVAGDDGDESFLSRTNEELTEAREWFKKCFKEKPADADEY